MSIYDAAKRYQADGVPLLILAGKEYGSGSSRDWAAKGTALLGVRAVLAESFERIHRSNLVGMGVLPLQFQDGDTAESLGLTGEEVFDITGLEGLADGAPAARRADGERRRPVFLRGAADRHAQGGGVLPPRRHPALRAAPAAGRLINSRGRARRRRGRGWRVHHCLERSRAWPGPGRSGGPAGAAPRPTRRRGRPETLTRVKPLSPSPAPVAGRMAGP